MLAYFKSSFVITPSPVLSSFLNASPMMFCLLCDIGGCNGNHFIYYQWHLFVKPAKLTLIFIKNSVILIAPSSSASNLKRFYFRLVKIPDFRREAKKKNTDCWKIFSPSSSDTSIPVSLSPLMNSSSDNCLLPSSSMRRNARPRPTIPDAPRAKQRSRNFSIGSFSVPSSNARWHLLINSDSLRDMLLDGRFAI